MTALRWDCRKASCVGGLLPGVLKDLGVRRVRMKAGEAALFGFLGEGVTNHERLCGVDACVEK